MNCDKALRLVERLADGEANATERAEAEGHLEGCDECRAHYEFVRAVHSASENIELPEPPEAYWQQFPSKVSARIEREERGERGGYWPSLFAPSLFRLGALAATVTIVVAVGVSVYRDDPRQLDPQMPATTETFEREQDTARLREEAADEKFDGVEETAPQESGAPAAAAPAPDVVAESAADAPAPAPEPEQIDLAASAPEASARRQAASKAPEARPGRDAVRASRVEAGEASAVLASASDQCAEWRRYLAENDNDDESDETREARYQVALCSLQSHETEPSDDTRMEALREGDAFLALEGDTRRAQEIRQRLEPLRP